MDGKEEIESLAGSVLQDVSPARPSKIKMANVLVKANHMITPKRAARIMKKVWMKTENHLKRSRSVQS